MRVLLVGAILAGACGGSDNGTPCDGRQGAWRTTYDGPPCWLPADDGFELLGELPAGCTVYAEGTDGCMAARTAECVLPSGAVASWEVRLQPVDRCTLRGTLTVDLRFVVGACGPVTYAVTSKRLGAGCPLPY